jgi:hypothetical protein
VSTSGFEPLGLLTTLVRERVRFVVVGAYAAQLRGVAVTTLDLDITPALEADNLDRLARVLHDFGATVRIENQTLGPVRLPADGALIGRTSILNLHLPEVGDVDVIHEAGPTGSEPPLDFAHLEPRATREPLRAGGVRLLVMSEEDWVDAKRRPPVRAKDRMHLRAYETWARARDDGRS